MAATATDEKLAADLASFRAEVARELSGQAEFRGTVKNDLRWIKAIGATLLLAAFGFAGEILWSTATFTSEVKQHETRLDKIETRLDKIETRLDGMSKQLETLIEHTAPKAP